jgi:hypothetical protein
MYDVGVMIIFVLRSLSFRLLLSSVDESRCCQLREVGKQCAFCITDSFLRYNFARVFWTHFVGTQSWLGHHEWLIYDCYVYFSRNNPPPSRLPVPPPRMYWWRRQNWFTGYFTRKVTPRSNRSSFDGFCLFRHLPWLYGSRRNVHSARQWIILRIFMAITDIYCDRVLARHVEGWISQAQASILRASWPPSAFRQLKCICK